MWDFVKASGNDGCGAKQNQEGNMKRRLSLAGGFTLLELLMVVIIIAILAALALPGYFRATERARTSEAQITMGQVRGAIQRWCVENGNGGVNSPAAFNQLDVELPTPPPAGNAQYNYAFPTAVTCGNPITIGNFVATRNGGPCVNSTVIMNDPPLIAGGSAFTNTWQPNPGPCN